MDNYVFIQFDESVNFLEEYEVYKKQLVDKLRPYFSHVLTDKFDPNKVGKCFSVHISLGKNPANPNLNHFYKYLTYSSPFPRIETIIYNLSTVYRSFRVNDLPKRRTSVIVFDMDDTLIDETTKPFYKDIFVELNEYRDYFQYIVLWTHGTTSYLSEIELGFKFDLYISRSGEETENKGLGGVLRELNRAYGVSSLDFCVLVDDGSFNFTDDYDLFVHVKTKPLRGTYKTALNDIIRYMNSYYEKKKFSRQISI